ncbi:MAG: site-specific integrase [Parvibaculum sp.]|uniref:tyrosine-type recombinase/integrase n=1 Tax=Parvibaculum sp. TaxID=2024848 RepID=UPI002842959B|nr:site-specific integrase [Parvibaculum sp.]MDR3500673.1 site-specific integrase [Parvibaculum sp.]
MIYDTAGHRKYLTIKEREAFIEAAQRLRPESRTFCLTLAYTGARISEVLALTPEHIDTEAGVVVIESLKKRRRGVYRAVPVPTRLLRQFEAVHDIAAAQLDTTRRTSRMWPWSRTTAWMLVKQIMVNIGVAPSRAMPKALRHAFGIGAAQKSVPINVIQKWMGHARITTTAIYMDVVGEEERALARRMWGF